MNKATAAQKIRRLYALASNPNPHEAMRARAKAEAMCLKHGLTRDEVLGGDPDLPPGMIRRVVDEGKHKPLHMRFVAGLIGRYFMVKAIGHTAKAPRSPSVTVHLLGREADVERAVYGYHKLRDDFKNAWGDYRVRTNDDHDAALQRARGNVDDFMFKIVRYRRIAAGDRRVQLSFYHGLARGIREGMEERLVRRALPPSPPPDTSSAVIMRATAFAPARALSEPAGPPPPPPGQTGLAIARDAGLDELALKVFQRDKIPERRATKQIEPDEAAMAAGYRMGRKIAIELTASPGSGGAGPA